MIFFFPSQGLRNIWRTKTNSHDSSILGDSTERDSDALSSKHCTMTPISSAWVWLAKTQGPTLGTCSKM